MEVSVRLAETVLVKETLNLESTPLSIRGVLLPYAEEVYVIDGGESGAFADVTFSDYYLDKDLPEIIRAAIAGTIGGSIYSFNVILVNPDPAEYQKIINLIQTTIKSMKLN